MAYILPGVVVSIMEEIFLLLDMIFPPVFPNFATEK